MNKKKKTQAEENIKMPEPTKPIEIFIWENTKEFQEWKKIRQYYIDNEKLIEQMKSFIHLSEMRIKEMNYLDEPNTENVLGVMNHRRRKKSIFEEIKKSLHELIPHLKMRFLEFAEKFDEMSITFKNKYKGWIDSIINNEMEIKSINIHINNLDNQQLLEFIVQKKLINDKAELFILLRDTNHIIEDLEKCIVKEEKW